MHAVLPGGHLIQAYRVRSHGIAFETIEGETIVLNLGTGTYFSMSGAALVAWSMLERGASAPQIAAELKSRYSADDRVVDGAVDSFLRELLHDQVIEVTADIGMNGLPDLPVGASEPFPGLSILRYTDIQELLLIDPVHEVDERGWPVRPDQG